MSVSAATDALSTPAPGAAGGTYPRFMSVKQVAEYLHINEKKVYALVREEKIPATKITGKWVFPRELVDRWLLESSHGGLLTDRLLVVGSDDPLLSRLALQLAHSVGARALVSYSPTGTHLGLALVAALRADVGCVHWGPDGESAIRHPALLAQHAAHKDWILVRAFRREQGLLLRSDAVAPGADLSDVLGADLRWLMRPGNAGSRRFLHELFADRGVQEDSLRQSRPTALSEREAAARLVGGEADITCGVRATATEYGLAFLPVGWEALDFALGRGVYFRALFQNLLDALRSTDAQAWADRLGGYDLEPAGELVWGME